MLGRDPIDLLTDRMSVNETGGPLVETAGTTSRQSVCRGIFFVKLIE